MTENAAVTTQEATLQVSTVNRRAAKELFGIRIINDLQFHVTAEKFRHYFENGNV